MKYKYDKWKINVLSGTRMRFLNFNPSLQCHSRFLFNAFYCYMNHDFYLRSHGDHSLIVNNEIIGWSIDDKKRQGGSNCHVQVALLKPALYLILRYIFLWLWFFFCQLIDINDDSIGQSWSISCLSPHLRSAEQSRNAA